MRVVPAERPAARTASLTLAGRTEHFSGSALDFRYVPIDISESALQSLASALDGLIPSEQVTGLVAEYQAGLRWLDVRLTDSDDDENYLGDGSDGVFHRCAFCSRADLEEFGAGGVRAAPELPAGADPCGPRRSVRGRSPARP